MLLTDFYIIETNLHLCCSSVKHLSTVTEGGVSVINLSKRYKGK